MNNSSLIEQVLNIIQMVLQPLNNQKRKQAEKALASLMDGSTEDLILCYLQLISTPRDQKYRIFAGTQIKKALAIFSQKKDKPWHKLGNHTQDKIKNVLMETLYRQREKNMRHNLCDLIGQLAGILMMNKNQQQWSNFKQTILKFFCSEDPIHLQSGFLTLQAFSGYSPDILKPDIPNLYPVFNNGMQHISVPVSLAALKCSSTLISSIKYQDAKKFTNLIIPIYQAVYRLLGQGQGQDALQALSDLIETQPKLIKKTVAQLFQLVIRIFDSTKQQGIRKMAIQMIVSLSQNLPSIFRKVKQNRVFAIQLIFRNMVAITNIVDQVWMSPPQGYNQDQQGDQDKDIIDFGMECVDRMIQSVGQSEMTGIIAQIVNKMLGNYDWRYSHAALMALSQVGQYIQTIQQISPIIKRIVIFAENSNPKIRYAFLHAIGQISDDMSTKFSQSFKQLLIPIMIKLASDSVPRVRGHSANALTNFLENLTTVSIRPYLNDLVRTITNLLQKGISIQKESAASAISSISKASLSQFDPYFQEISQYLFNMLKSCNDKKYILLKSRCLQSLTIIGESVGADRFRPMLQPIIKIMIQMQQKVSQVDPQKSYIISGWQRLALIYGDQLSKWLPQIIPDLFKIIKTVLKQEDKIFDQQSKINTYQTQQAQLAIFMLNIFVQKLAISFRPYVNDTCQILFPIIKNHLNDVVRNAAFTCLPNLLKTVENEREIATSLVRQFLSLLVQVAQKQDDTAVLVNLMNSLKNCIDTLKTPFLSQQQISIFSEKMLKFLFTSDQRKQQKVKQKQITQKQQQDVQQDEIQQIQQEEKLEQQVQVGIANVIGILFKTHRQQTVQLANYVLRQIIPKTLKPGLSQSAHRLAIYILVDMVQYMGIYFQDKWSQFFSTLVNFAAHPTHHIRQAAAYGLGVFSQKTPLENFQKYSHQLNIALMKSIQVPIGNQKQKIYKICKDNAIASIGKAIKTHGVKVANIKEMMNIWFKYLPMRFDKQEARGQHDFLADISLNNPDLILTGLDELKHLLKVFGQIVNKEKLCSKQTRVKIKNFLIIAQNKDIFKKNWQNIKSYLTLQQIKRLSQLLV